MFTSVFICYTTKYPTTYKHSGIALNSHCLPEIFHKELLLRWFNKTTRAPTLPTVRPTQVQDTTF